jgi:hypothetical protein
MSDNIKTLTIKTLAGEFQRGELQKEFNSLFIKSKQAVERIKELETEVAHLKDLLTNAVPIVNLGTVENKLETLEISNAQLICENQIARLKDRAMQTELTLEDSKKLDIYIKNLKILTEKKDSKTINTTARDIPEETLLTIAAQTTDDSNKDLP